MSGLYIHIPFCSTRCSYCDFYSQTETALQTEYIEALKEEMDLRREETTDVIHTVYFGGGTPSLLRPRELEALLKKVRDLFILSSETEFTIEANPDDLSPGYVKEIASLGFNRISMGAQSFRDEDLAFLNRRHNVKQIYKAVDNCRQEGVMNISIDLIYGLPGQTTELWEANIDAILSIAPPHISAYHLIYEEGTPLTLMLKQGKIKETDEETSLELFQLLREKLLNAGYEHYEISNFAQPNFHSRHNSSYWEDAPYLGLGPSAHSFDGKNIRRANPPSIRKYILAMKERKPFFTKEILSKKERYNEVLMTRLRTSRGLDPDLLKKQFGEDYAEYCLQSAKPFIHNGLLRQETNNTIRLTEKGIFLSDSIISELFLI